MPRIATGRVSSALMVALALVGCRPGALVVSGAPPAVSGPEPIDRRAVIERISATRPSDAWSEEGPRPASLAPQAPPIEGEAIVDEEAAEEVAEEVVEAINAEEASPEASPAEPGPLSLEALRAKAGPVGAPPRRAARALSIISREIELTKRLINNLRPDAPDLPSRRRRLAEAYEDAARSAASAPRSLDAPVGPSSPASPVSLRPELRPPPAGQMTAASVSDADRRQNYLRYLDRHQQEASELALDLTRRVRFRVLDHLGRPVADAPLSLQVGHIRATGRSHGDGVWDLYPGLEAPGFSGEGVVQVRSGQGAIRVPFRIPHQGDGPEVVLRLSEAPRPQPPRLDLAFLIDATGSMEDELAYVREEILGVVERVRGAAPGVRVRLAGTFYRDRGDLVPLSQIPFTDDLPLFAARLRQVVAQGGGDYPEDLEMGLAAAITTLDWSREPAIRVLVLIADAPPHPYADSPYSVVAAMSDASARGIRILPVAASGADRVVEYLFRAMGAVTGAPYVYLTDDSGLGGHHMEADTDRVAVEMFSDLLTRLLIAELRGEGMHEPISPEQGAPIPGQ